MVVHQLERLENDLIEVLQHAKRLKKEGRLVLSKKVLMKGDYIQKCISQIS